jgi:hypothetical protein
VPSEICTVSLIDLPLFALAVHCADDPGGPSAPRTAASGLVESGVTVRTLTLLVRQRTGAPPLLNLTVTRIFMPRCRVVTGGGTGTDGTSPEAAAEYEYHAMRAISAQAVLERHENQSR